MAGHDVRLKIYSDFSNDSAQLSRAIDAPSVRPRAHSGSGPILSAVDKHHMMYETGRVYEALEVLGNAMRGVKGRKNLILFSPGILEPGQDIRHGMIVAQSRYYQPMIDSLNATNVTVYAMNLLEDVPRKCRESQTLESGAGHEWRLLPASRELRSADQARGKQTNGYYLITYTSHHPKSDRGYQKVDVDVKSKEFA